MESAKRWMIALSIVIAANCIGQAANGIRQLGTLFSYWNEARDVVLVDEFAYIATGITGLSVVDVSDPQHPTEVGKYDDFDEAVDHLFIVEGLLYATDYNSATILDISERAVPRFVNQAGIWCLNGAVAVNGTTMLTVGEALFGYDGSYLIRYDLTDQSNPTATDTLYLPEHRYYDIAIQDESAYLITEQTLLSTDLSNPDQMTVQCSARCGGGTSQVIPLGEVAYVTSGGRGLEVFLVSDPTNLTVQRNLNYGSGTNDALLIDDHLFLASRGVTCLDVTNPYLPTFVSQTSVRNSAYAVTGTLSCLISANGPAGIVINDFRDLEHPDSLGTINSPGEVGEVVLRDGIAYVAAKSEGLKIIDATDPQNPTLLSSMVFPGWATRISIQDDQAFVASRPNGIQIIDITDPNTPDLVSTYSSPNYSYGYAVKNGDVLYVAGNNLEAVDISNPVTPRLRSSCRLSIPIQNFVISGNYAYLVGKISALDFSVVDVSNPDSLVEIYCDSLLQEEYWTTTTDIIVEDGIAYVLFLRGLLVILDVSDPKSPKELARLDDPRFGFARFSKHGSFLLMATRYEGLQICDISILAEPRFVGDINDCFYMQGVSVEGDVAAVAQYGSLRFYDISEVLGVEHNKSYIPVSTNLLSAYPNPFNSNAIIKVNLPQNAPLQLVLFDASGREWNRWELSVNNGSFQNKIILDGNQLPSGSFYLQAVGAGRSGSIPMIHLK